MAFHSISLCSGYAGLDLAVNLACPGVFEPILCVERELSVAEILAARIDEGALAAAPIWSDVKTVCTPSVRNYLRARTADRGIGLIMAGYPCQPFSGAGRRGGRDDPCYVWPWIADAIDCYHPAICFFENVPGHLRLGFGRVRDGLEARGYRVQAGLFSAAEVGSPHTRLRLFVVAAADFPYSVGLNVANAERPRLERRIGEVVARSGRGRPDADAGRSSFILADWPPARNNFKRWHETLREHPWLAPAVGPSEAESRFRGMAHGFAANVDVALARQWNARLRACGNGVVPEAAAFAFISLLAQAAAAG